MIYARAHDQTVADDYFIAMQRVELSLEIAPTHQAPSTEELEHNQLLALVEYLTQPELCFPARLETISQLRQALDWVEMPEQACEHPSPEFTFM